MTCCSLASIFQQLGLSTVHGSPPPPKKTVGDWSPCRDYQALNNVIQYYTLKHHRTAPLFYPRLTWSEPTTRFLSSQLISPKQQSLHHFGYSKSFVCLQSAAQTFQRSIDRVLNYHQIPVKPADIPKIAVTTLFGLFEFILCHLVCEMQLRHFSASLTEYYMAYTFVMPTWMTCSLLVQTQKSTGSTFDWYWNVQESTAFSSILPNVFSE